MLTLLSIRVCSSMRRACMPCVPSDIFRTLKFLGFLRWARGEHVISVTPRQLDVHRQTYCTQRPGRTSSYVQFDASKLRWVPPPPWKEKKTDKPSHRRMQTQERQASQETASTSKEKQLNGKGKK